MKKTGTVAGTCPMVWRSTPHTGLLSRPIIGHTPRKLPPCGAISRFIAVSARGKASTTRDLIIISDIQRNVKTFFSVFHSFFEIFLAVRRCTRQRGKCPPPGHFPLRYLIPDQAASAYYMVYRSGTKNTGMLCTPVFLIIYVLRCPAWPSVRRSSPGTLHPSGIPAPGW